ncbi:5-dehydro-2-deoxygluconokinase [Enterobacter asburiae]|uniref:5-dehydro-2-deoxygluconokinase n=1 Tax=Enterobacter asburiae TaxID=61645 RepID=A0A376FLA0_ENTAS|nr:5-dehydro-2-deoxygluconokinase [Enterobacter asburiae]
MEKQFDVICMGRVAVDLYSQQIGARLEDASSFAKYLGGSSGNVAYGTARQGYVRRCWRASAMNIWAASCGKSSTRWAAIPAI